MTTPCISECIGCKCWHCGNLWCHQWLICEPKNCTPHKEENDCKNYCDSASEG